MPELRPSRARRHQLPTVQTLGLTDFETKAECRRRNQAMKDRLDRVWSDLRAGEALALDYLGSPNNFEGDWLTSRAYRRNLIPQAVVLLLAGPEPLHFVTFSHPAWRTELGQLRDFSIEAAKQRIARALRRLPGSPLLIGGLEVSIGVDLNQKALWEPHLHGVVCGVEADALREALAIEPQHRLIKHDRPLLIEPVGDLPRRLAYSLKRVAKRRIAYIGTNGRQQRRKLPLTTSEQNELDRWLLGMPVGSRTFLIGCRLQGRDLCRTSRRRRLPSYQPSED